MIYGGMPAVVLQRDKKLKRKMLEEYVSAYVNKDIRVIGKIESIARFNALVKILSSQIGNLLNISELSNAAKISRRNTEKYLDLLEYTFVLDKISPFKKNVRKQVIKMPKIYFFDMGVRNAILGIFENFVFLELKNQRKNKIFFYRSVNKAEIDFVIEEEAKIILIESKYKKLVRPIDSRVLENFLEKEKNVKKAVVVNLNLNRKDNSVEYIDYRRIRTECL